MKLIVPALSVLSAVAYASAAQAVPLDVSPLVNEAIADVAVPVLFAVAPAAAAVILLPLRRFLDQNANAKLAGNINDLLDKSIAFAAKQAEQFVTEKDFHANVDGWIANIAADYAVKSAPKVLKQAGAVASIWAGKAAKDAAADLLTQKIAARQDLHPAVVALKAKAPAAPAVAAPVAA